MVFAFIGAVGWPELVIVLLVVLLFFGASRLPSLARSLGASAKELRDGLDGDDEVDEPAEDSEVS